LGHAKQFKRLVVSLIKPDLRTFEDFQNKIQELRLFARTFHTIIIKLKTTGISKTRKSKKGKFKKKTAKKRQNKYFQANGKAAQW